MRQKSVKKKSLKGALELRLKVSLSFVREADLVKIAQRFSAGGAGEHWEVREADD